MKCGNEFPWEGTDRVKDAQINPECMQLLHGQGELRTVRYRNIDGEALLSKASYLPGS